MNFQIFKSFFTDFKNVLNNLNTGIRVQLDLHFDIDNIKLVKKLSNYI